MKKVMVSVFLAATCVAFAENIDNTELGENTLRQADGVNNSVFIGGFAGSWMNKCYDSVYIGTGAGMNGADNTSNIAIGNGALNGAKMVSGTVAIGDAEMAGESYNSDTTSINAKQLWVSKTFDAFAINPQKSVSITNAPVWYRDGKLMLNISKLTSTAPIYGSTGEYPHYDYYLSPFGNDNSDGRTQATAVRSIQALLDKTANVTNRLFSVCVFAGEYEPPKSFTDSNPYGGTIREAIQTTNSFEFHAIEGKERTFIVGELNEHEYGYGHHNSLCFNDTIEYYQLFDGFTIKNIDNRYPSGKSYDGGSQNSRAALGLCRFNDCDFVFDATNGVKREVITGYWGAFADCQFTNCRFTDARFKHYTSFANIATFSYCDFISCLLDGIEYDANNYSFKKVFGGLCNSLNSVFRITANTCEGVIIGSENNYAFTDCTLIENKTSQNRIFVNRAHTFYTNCYYCAEQGYQLDWQNAVDCIVGASWTNTLLNADFKASSIDCPVVRINGQRDCGAFDSGLNTMKMLKTRCDLRLNGSNIEVYDGTGSKIGTIPFSPLSP